MKRCLFLILALLAINLSVGAKAENHIIIGKESVPTHKSIVLGRIIQGNPINYTFYIENKESQEIHILKVVPD